jgi:hypothetical protein
MAVDGHGEARGAAFGDMASALSDVASAIREVTSDRRARHLPAHCAGQASDEACEDCSVRIHKDNHAGT